MKAIGIKMVDLAVMCADYAKSLGYNIGNSGEQNGYEVTYPDGYKSWSPASIAIRAYYPLLDPEGSKITEGDVINFIVEGEGIKLGDKTTVVMDSTITGFDTIGTSACVDPSRYNQEYGNEIARRDIKDKIWEHFGFVLQWAKNGLTYNTK